jgi:hypothetical protein
MPLVLTVVVSVWLPLAEMERRGVFKPESIHASCVVGDLLVLGTSKSRLYTLNLRSAELSKPALVDGTRHYPNSLHNTIHSVAPLPGGRVACSYFGEIHIIDFAKGVTVKSAKRDEDILHLCATDNLLVGADWKSRLYAYDPLTLAQLWVLDLGRDKSLAENVADNLYAPVFDRAARRVYVARSDTRCAVVTLSGQEPLVERPFRRGDELSRRGRCFLIGSSLYENAQDKRAISLVRSELGVETRPESVSLKSAVAEAPRGLVALPGGGLVALFREEGRPPDVPQRSVLRVYDVGLAERSSADVPVRAPLALVAGPGDMLVVIGADGIALLTMQAGRVTWSKLVRLPFPYTVPETKDSVMVAPIVPRR